MRAPALLLRQAHLLGPAVPRVMWWPGAKSSAAILRSAAHAALAAYRLSSAIASVSWRAESSKELESEHTPSTLCASSKMTTALSQRTCVGEGHAAQ